MTALTRVLCVALIVVVLATLWCRAGAQAPGLAEPVRLVVWSYQLPGEMDFYQDALEAFEKRNAGLHTRLSMVGWETAAPTARRWLTDKEEPADVILIRDLWMPELGSMLAPLDGRLPAKEQKAYFPAALNRCHNGEHLIGLPWVTRTKALYYRPSLFRAAGVQPPKTWEELASAAAKLARPPETYGLGLPCALAESSADSLLSLTWGLGGEVMTSGGELVLGSELETALGLVFDLTNVRHGTQPETCTWRQGDVEAFFALGHLAMVISEPWLARFLDTQFPKLDYAVASLPALMGEGSGGALGSEERNPRAEAAPSLISVDMLAIASNSHHPEQAARLLGFLAQDRYAGAFAALAGVPAKPSLARQAPFAGDGKLAAFVRAVEDARALPPAKAARVQSLLAQMLFEVVSGRKSPSQALADLKPQDIRVVRPDQPSHSAPTGGPP